MTFKIINEIKEKKRFFSHGSFSIKKATLFTTA